MGISLLIAGCYYDREDELYGVGTCDVSNVTYTTTIQGILNRYSCLSCHAGASPSGGVNLSTYAGIKAKVTDGRLFGAINHNSGFTPMPDGGGKMNACDINKVKAWIDAGAPQN